MSPNMASVTKPYGQCHQMGCETFRCGWSPTPELVEVKHVTPLSLTQVEPWIKGGARSAPHVVPLFVDRAVCLPSRWPAAHLRYFPGVEGISKFGNPLKWLSSCWSPDLGCSKNLESMARQAGDPNRWDLWQVAAQGKRSYKGVSCFRSRTPKMAQKLCAFLMVSLEIHNKWAQLQTKTDP